MSVQSEINRISSAVSSAYSAISDMGGTIPSVQSVDNLADAIRSVKMFSEINIVSSDYTVTSSDAGKLILAQSSDEITITLTNSLELKDEIEIGRYGTGSVTISAGTGAVLYSAGDKYSLTNQYSICAVKCVGTVTDAIKKYIVAGDLS